MPAPTKSQNQTILGQGGPYSTQCSKPNWACSWHHPFGTIRLAPTTTLHFDTVHKTKYRMRAIIGRSQFEAAPVYKPRILSLKNEEFPFLVHKLSAI